MPILVGIDFDNTIVCYDQLFHTVAVERGLIPPAVPASKGPIRDHLRQAGQEDAWTELQGYVYGPRIREATAFPGAIPFLRRCRREAIAVCIVSHKTRHPYRGPAYDLHAAARDWLRAQGVFDPGDMALPESRAIFELTLEDKLRAIGRMGCTHFIDDLPEFLAEPAFPPDVRRILFDPGDRYREETRFTRLGSWAAIADLIAAEARAS